MAILKCLRNTCILLHFLFLTYSAQSQTRQAYYFHNLNITNGLSQNTVNAILQDKSGFMWFGTKDGLNRYDGISFRVFKDNRLNYKGLKYGFVTTLFEGDNGNIWVGTDMGAYSYDPYTEHFEHFNLSAQNGAKMNKTVNKIGRGLKGKIMYAVDGLGLFVYDIRKKSLQNYPFPGLGSVRDFQVDSWGRIWISFYKGLYLTDDHFETLKPYKLSDGSHPFEKESVTVLHFGKSNKLYVGSEKNGMMEVDLMAHKIARVPLSDQPAAPIFVRGIYPYSDQELWIGTETGIYIFNTKTKAHKHLQNKQSDPSSLSDNAIYSMCKDREGGMWIGSYFGGINYYSNQRSFFEKYYPTNDASSLQGQRVREICKGKGEDLWIGTEDAGLFSFNISTKAFRHFAPSVKFSNIHGLCMDGDNLWVGTFSKGVHVVNTVTGAVKSYLAEDMPRTIEDNYVFSILKSSGGDIYLGTSRNLIKYNKATDRFEKISELGHNLIYDIKEDSGNNIWVATYTNGVYRLDSKTRRWEHYKASDKKGSLPHGKILSIFEDSRHQIWLSTQGRGFGRFDVQRKIFIPYQDEQSTKYDVVYQIVEDDQGLFWLTTNSGLIRFQPGDGSTKVYTVASGLLSNQFNYKSSYKAEDGRIFLGCINGLISFNPNSFSENTYVPPVYITDFLLFGKPVAIAEGKSPLRKSILYSDSITLDHSQNHFSLRIAALSYQAPEVNGLQYKLEGIGEDWKNITESSLISYSNLSSGNYLFRVRGSNNDKLWNPKEKTLYINILPPFYRTGWAYMIYFMLLLTITYLLLQFFRNRQKLRQKWFMQEVEQQKEREIHDAKISFFTNITHEIRTPLTLIKGPLEHIISTQRIADRDTQEELQIMKQNTNRLLDLTNQLLDFRKTEREGFLLNLSECRVSSLVSDLFQSFLPLAKEYNRNFLLEPQLPNFSAYVDKEAFTKILSNLFSNAIKYADKYVLVTLLAPGADGYFEVRVSSDGALIPEENHENIFKPFTRFSSSDQAKVPGTGIGLHLARSLAELHSGVLNLQTDEGKNVFTLSIPLAYAPQNSARETEPEHFDEKEMDLDAKAHTLLIVEDNLEMQRFVQKILPERYKVLIASNGQEALDLLKRNFVTLVISDIMMPVMTGIELCRRIKEDIHYSHVPVILLTAKTNLQSKIEGIDVGADAYVEKPFSQEYLLAIVANLINNREKLKEAYLKNPMVVSNAMINTEADKDFMNTLRKVILANIGNADLKMEDIAESLNMSRASFYRKLKGLLDLKPNEYLRLERLKMAAQLIRDDKYPIGEICYMVGFNSPSYFARCFQEQFGILPKDYK